MLDAELLAEVYVELTGGRQTGLSFESEAFVEVISSQSTIRPASQRPAALLSLISEVERVRHAALIETLGEKAIWRRYTEPVPADDRAMRQGLAG